MGVSRSIYPSPLTITSSSEADPFPTLMGHQIVWRLQSDVRYSLPVEYYESQERCVEKIVGSNLPEVPKRVRLLAVRSTPALSHCYPTRE